MANTMGLVLGTYLMCYLPTAVYNIISNQLYTPPQPFAILLGNRILNVTYKMQCVLNQVIYGYKNLAFRKAYKKLLCGESQPYNAEIQAISNLNGAGPQRF